MTEARLIPGLAALASRYDAFLLDQFGVLHDGSTVYPGVVPCLEALQAAGKRVLILSNSGTREAANRERLTRLGVAPSLYEAFVTSGEVAREFLAAAPPELRRAGNPDGLRCLPLGGPSAEALLAGLEVAITDQVGEADFLLVAGFGLEPPPLDAFEVVLAEARTAGLTLLCANPDVKGVSARGLIHAPGALAAAYEAAGGRVVYIGKPHPLIYRHVLRTLAPLPPARVLTVGDSLSHDVAGARGVGLAAALVVEGIHRAELGDPKEPAFGSRLTALEQRAGVQADYLLRRLAW